MRPDPLARTANLVSTSFVFSAAERLFARYKLGPIRSLEPLSGGQLNTALRVNGEYVLRCREPALSTGSLLREAALLPALGTRVPAPEVVVGGIDDLLGEFLIQHWVEGRSLLGAWMENPDVATREWWIVQWVAAIRAIHEERFERAGELPGGALKEYPTWRNYVETRIRKRLDTLMRTPGVDREMVLAGERYLRRHAAALQDGPFCLIHRDLHFANVLVDGPRLTAILDFELAESGPLDYELDTIFRFLRYPWLFAPPGAGSRLTPARFASVWGRLKRGYPELFNAPHLRVRLSLYALDHALSSLAQVYRGRWGGEAAAESTLARLAEILQGRYGPE